MRLLEEFDLNLNAVQPIKEGLAGTFSSRVENLVRTLTRKGYTVIRSSVNYMGMPQSITLIKEFTGPFVSFFSTKMKEDFSVTSRELGIERLFM